MAIWTQSWFCSLFLFSYHFQKQLYERASLKNVKIKFQEQILLRAQPKNKCYFEKTSEVQIIIYGIELLFLLNIHFSHNYPVFDEKKFGSQDFFKK